VTSVEGFGEFDADGNARALSWREALQTTLEGADV